LAATFTMEEGQSTPAGGNGNFWLQGGSLDLGFTVLHRFGWATNLTGGHTSNIGPGVGLNVIDFMTGPRYTVRLATKSKHESRFFVEALAGGARGFSSVFPKSSGLDDKAASFAWQAGGGLDISISKHLAIRVVEADYVRSYLPNNGSNVQDHIRLAAGVTYHSTNR
jgi:peptidoglycan-associated lipoprotein